MLSVVVLHLWCRNDSALCLLPISTHTLDSPATLQIPVAGLSVFWSCCCCDSGQGLFDSAAAILRGREPAFGVSVVYSVQASDVNWCGGGDQSVTQGVAEDGVLLSFTATHSIACMGDPSNKDRADTRNKEPDSHIQTSGGKRRCNTHRHSRSRHTNGDTLCDRLLGHQLYRRIALPSLASNAVRMARSSVTLLQQEFR